MLESNLFKKDNILSITNNFENLKTVQFSTNEYKSDLKEI